MDAFAFFKRECGDSIVPLSSDKYEVTMFSIYSYLPEADKAFFEHLEMTDILRFDEE
jgi:hypothetical protein